MASLFEVISEVELLALHRALLEAKFASSPNDQDLAASKYLVDMVNRIAAEVVARKPEWKDWFVIDSSRREWSSALGNAVSQRLWWMNASAEARIELSVALLAPFHVDQRLADQFVTEVDRTLQLGEWYALWRAIGGSSIRVVIERPDVSRPGGFVILASDGAVLLHHDDEIAATEWLVTNGFEFVAAGLDRGLREDARGA